MIKKTKIEKPLLTAEDATPDELKSYDRLLDRLEALLAEENPPIPIVMAACNVIMCRMVEHGSYTKDDVLRVLRATLDLRSGDKTTLQ